MATLIYAEDGTLNRLGAGRQANRFLAVRVNENWIQIPVSSAYKNGQA